MEGCVFCKIVKGEIPCHRIAKGEGYLAFLDIHPAAEGHTVVIPTKHAETIFDLSEQENALLMQAVVKVMAKLDKLHPDGFNVGWNHNAAGGQVVPHLHLHILPRFNGDGGGSMHSIVKNPGRRTVEEVAKLLG